MLQTEMGPLEPIHTHIAAKVIRCQGTKGLDYQGRKIPIVFPEIIAPVLLDLRQRSERRIWNVLCMSFYPAFYEALPDAVPVT